MSHPKVHRRARSRTLAGVLLVVSAVPLLGAPACSQPRTESDAPYDFMAADDVFKLDKDLDEVSGLAWLNADTLLAIQDEKGRLYRLSTADGSTTGTSRFSSDRDYEAVEVTAEATYVLESDGDLYRIPRSGGETQRVETLLSRRNDTEGLALDPTTGALWVVCKEDPGSDLKGVRAVYAFDPASATMAPDPVLIVQKSEVNNGFTEEDAVSRLARRWAEALADMDRFKPSAIAFHPSDETIYLLNSVEPSVIIMTRSGEVLHVLGLDERLPQPEGLTFSPDGTLYVASEGAGGRGRLAVFTPKNQSAE